MNQFGGLKGVVVESNTPTLLGPLPVGTVIPIGNFVYNEDEKGAGLLAGLKYNLSPRTNFGLEYLTQSYGVAPTTIRSPNFNPMYNTIGQAQHLYFNQRLLPELTLNLGVVNRVAKSHFDNNLFHQRTRRESQIVYSALRFRF